jgi:CMP-N,N'-diacetyllegionaminic acid synthase
MLGNKRVLSIVPARIGSKRLPKKNLRRVAGKSLLEWTLDVSNDSRIIDKTVLSTDDKSIADLALNHESVDIVMRGAEYATDTATLTSVIRNVLAILADKSERFEYLVLLQPTSPLRTAQHIDQAFEFMNDKGACGLVSVCPTEHPLEWMGKLSEDGLLDSFFWDTQLERQSQAFEPSYQVNGAIYIVPVEKFLTHKTLFLPHGMAAFVMERQESVDIDNEHDLQLAEWLLRRRRVAEVSQDDDERPEAKGG